MGEGVLFPQIRCGAGAFVVVVALVVLEEVVGEVIEVVVVEVEAVASARGPDDFLVLAAAALFNLTLKYFQLFFSNFYIFVTMRMTKICSTFSI